MTTAKDLLRRQLIVARRQVPAALRAAEAIDLTRHIGGLATQATVCAYVPVGSEPGSVAMLDAMCDAGVRVLLPVAIIGEDSTPLPLSWGEYRTGELVAARWGLREPAGARLPPETLAEAAVVIVPALAVDRRGVRLGRGAGFYDRSLPLREPSARLVAVVRDGELVDDLPAEPHDVRMTHAVTPSRGIVALG